VEYLRYLLRHCFTRGDEVPSLKTPISRRVQTKCSTAQLIDLGHLSFFGLQNQGVYTKFGTDIMRYILSLMSGPDVHDMPRRIVVWCLGVAGPHDIQPVHVPLSEKHRVFFILRHRTDTNMNSYSAALPS
jgi:hypothetical protein